MAYRTSTPSLLRTTTTSSPWPQFHPAPFTVHHLPSSPCPFYLPCSRYGLEVPLTWEELVGLIVRMNGTDTDGDGQGDLWGLCSYINIKGGAHTHTCTHARTCTCTYTHSTHTDRQTDTHT